MSSDAVTVFFSYSHQDEALRDELAKHLSILRRNDVISDWHDRQIPVGGEWDREVNENLNSAQIILLLISADFMASRYCYDIEVTRAMERYEAKDATVIPIILRTCLWTDAPFGKLQGLPKNVEPVDSWPNQDQAFTDIAKGIKKAANDIRQKLKAAKQAQLDYYETTYTAAIKQAYPLPEVAQGKLNRLQTALGLSDTDIAPIVTRLSAEYGEGKQKLEKYRKEVQLCLEEDEGQISGFSRTILETYRAQFGLTPEEAKAVEEEELHPYTAKQDAIAQYQKVLADALKQENPISERTRRRLKRLQAALKLSDEDTQEIEADYDEESKAQRLTQQTQDIENQAENNLSSQSITSEQTSYIVASSDVDRVIDHRMQYRKRVGEYLADRQITTLEEILLSQLRQELGLSEADAQQILAEEEAPLEKARSTYRDALRGLVEAGHYPLDDQTHLELQQLIQILKLPKTEAEEIERPILAAANKEYFLKSEKGIDYSKLQKLLQAKDWKAADQETYKVMNQILGAQWSSERLMNFPCVDLLTIDLLWVTYSDGKFGFSVQKEIYRSCGGIANGEHYGDTWGKFGNAVGWRRKDGSWKFTFTEDKNEPSGHLPYLHAWFLRAIAFDLAIRHRTGEEPAKEIKRFVRNGVQSPVSSFFSRVQTCKV